MGWADIQPTMRAQSEVRHADRDARRRAILKAIWVNADDPEFRLGTLSERFARTEKSYMEKLLLKLGFRFDTWGRFTAMPITLKVTIKSDLGRT